MTTDRESVTAFLATLQDPEQTPAVELRRLLTATARRRHRPSYLLCREGRELQRGPVGPQVGAGGHASGLAVPIRHAPAQLLN
jgi:hypothetical protein